VIDILKIIGMVKIRAKRVEYRAFRVGPSKAYIADIASKSLARRYRFANRYSSRRANRRLSMLTEYTYAS